MKKLRTRLRAALVAVASAALLMQPAFAGGHSSKGHSSGSSSNNKKSSSTYLCEYCVWLPGIDCYGELSEDECCGADTKAKLKLNYKNCSIQLSAKGKVCNDSCYGYCEYVNPYDFVYDVCNNYCGYGEDYCWYFLECLDCCIYKVDAPKPSHGHSKSSNQVNASLKCTGYCYDYDPA